MPLYEAKFLGDKPKKVDKTPTPPSTPNETNSKDSKETINNKSEETITEPKKVALKRKRAPRKPKVEAPAPVNNALPEPTPPPVSAKDDIKIEKEPEIIKPPRKKAVVKKSPLVDDTEPPNWFKKYIKEKTLRKLRKNMMAKSTQPVATAAQPQASTPKPKPVEVDPQVDPLRLKMNYLYKQIHCR